MNFNFFVLILFIFVGCGVKGVPVHPDGTEMPSIPSQYKELKVKQKLNEAQLP